MVTADTILVNGKVATVDKHFSYKQAIAVKNGWIIDVGENDEINAYKGAGTKVIDLEGKVVLPGIHDGHVHLCDWSDNLFNTFNCSRMAVPSLEVLRNTLAEKAKTAGSDTWIRGAGMDGDSFEECRKRGFPINCHDIDSVTPDVPVVIIFWDGHTCLANSKAMEINGITRDTPNPPGGEIGRDANGNLTGMFHEASALQLVFKKMPRFTVDEIAANLQEAQKIMNSMGYTSYTECTIGTGNTKRERGASGELGIEAYRKLQEQGKLTARVSLGFYSALGGVQSYEVLKNDLENFPFPIFNDSNWLDMRMVKLFCDGIHMAYSAWMKEDYADNPGVHGHSCLLGPGATDEEQEAELRRMIKLAHDHGYQVGVHTIGNRAVQATLDAFIMAQQENPRKFLRHYLIHADSLGDREDLRRAARYGIGLSSQSNLADFAYEITIERVGKEKGEMLMGLRDLEEMGLHIANGSDTIGGPYGDWLHAIRAAVTRKSRITGNVYRPDLAITVEQAIREFTMGGAYQEFKEDVRGSIEPGKVADFTVIDRDIFNIDPETITEIKVVMTIVDGRIVFQS